MAVSTLTGRRLSARIAALATYAPDHCVTNRDLERRLDTSDAWIVQRTGIRERRVAAPDVFASDLCVAAARRLAERVSLADVDLVVAATSTADYVFPSLAAQVQDALGLAGAGAFDVAAACAGFVYAFNAAAGFIASGQARQVLLLGGEVMSKSVDQDDRSTAILFGDGAGAALLVAGDERSYVEAVSFGSDGAGGKHLYRTATRSEIAGRDDPSGLLRQAGAEVYKWAISRVPEAVGELLAAAGVRPGEVDWFVPHSANLRIVDALCMRTGIARERTLTSIEAFGNTSAASIPLALAPAIADGRVRRGDRIVTFSFGGGLVWSGAILRF